MKKGTIDPRRRLAEDFSLDDLLHEQQRYHRRTGRAPDAIRLTRTQQERMYALIQRQTFTATISDVGKFPGGRVVVNGVRIES